MQLDELITTLTKLRKRFPGTTEVKPSISGVQLVGSNKNSTVFAVDINRSVMNFWKLEHESTKDSKLKTLKKKTAIKVKETKKTVKEKIRKMSTKTKTTKKGK